MDTLKKLMEIFLTLVPTKESKEKILKNELLSKIRDLIRSINKNLDDYDEKYMKITFNLDDELPLNDVRAIFYESNKYSAQGFLDGCLYKL